MRIGILSTCEHYGWAGTEEVWFHFARESMRQGHEVVLGVHEKVARSKQVIELQGEGLRVCVRRPRRPMRLYLLKERYRSEMADLLDCDVIIINSGSLYDTMSLPWVGQFFQSLVVARKRIIYFCHFCAESLPATSHASERVVELVSGVSEWVFVSEHNKALAQRQLATRFEKATVVMNGPRLSLDNPLPLPEGPPTFGCVARIETRWKGHDALLECFSRPEWRGREWRLNIYGSGPDESYLQRLVDHFALGDHVKLCGYVRDMKSVWESCHLKVLCSHGEGTPLAVLEAMMCGRGVVTTDVGGNLEVLEPGVTGFVADCATPRSFGPALEEAWRRRDDWSAIGKAAHTSAKQLADADPAARLLEVVTS